MSDAGFGMTVCSFNLATNRALRARSRSSSASSIPSPADPSPPGLPRLSPKANGMGFSDMYCIRVGCGGSYMMICSVCVEAWVEYIRGKREVELV